MTAIALFFGGKSSEHEVSIRSAKNIAKAMPSSFQCLPVAITKNGSFYLCDYQAFVNSSDNAKIEDFQQTELGVKFGHKHPFFNLITGESIHVDVCFPILHGTLGEDGSMQGLFRVLNLPFVGAGVMGSAAGMDKDVMKRLLIEKGLPVGHYIALRKHETLDLTVIRKIIGYPCFVKPASNGSSVGVSKVKEEADLQKACDLAFRFDHKILIEEFIEGREIECAVLGNSQPRASITGEIIPGHDFYSYEAKYIDDKGAELSIPAKIPDDLSKKIREIAIQTYLALECEGMGRVDVFLRGQEIFINEINTLPGFTSISMYPKLWEHTGISGNELINKLIELAFERFQKESKLEIHV